MELVTRGLRIERGGRTLVDALEVTLRGGEIWVVLGPNGAGKSSLLLALSGIVPASGGTIELGGTPLGQLGPRERSRRLAWQGELPRAEFGFTVEERLGLVPSAARKPEAALDRLELGSLATRRLAELSAGERQRVELAALWLREAPVWLMDEPTAYLDLRHQVHWLETLRHERDHGRTIVVVLHDLTQAHAVADGALLVRGDGPVLAGPGEALMEPSALEDLYRTPLEQVRSSHGLALLPRYPAKKAKSEQRSQAHVAHPRPV